MWTVVDWARTLRSWSAGSWSDCWINQTQGNIRNDLLNLSGRWKGNFSVNELLAGRFHYLFYNIVVLSFGYFGNASMFLQDLQLLIDVFLGGIFNVAVVLRLRHLL